MKIKSLVIDNFRGIQHLEVLFGDRMNVFVGENGAGKSTVLQALRYLLSWFIARILNRNGSGMRLSQSDITLGKSFCRLIIQLEDGTMWKLFKASNKYRGANFDKTDLTELTALTDVMVGDYERLGKCASFPVIGCYGVNRAVADAKPTLAKKSKEKPLDSYDIKLNNGQNFNRFFNWYREREDIENESLRNSGKLKPDSQLSAVREALNMVSPSFGDFHVNRNPRAFMMKKEGQDISMEQLSDGEKCYLTLIGDIARMLAMTNPQADAPLKGQGCILIDEIDLHLHPLWQSEILGRLTQIFPNCQFMVTTHSPFVVSNVKTFEKDKFFMMNHCEALEATTNTYGKRIDQILLEFFHVNSLRNADVEQNISQIWSLLSSPTRNEAEYESLKDWLRQRIDNSDEVLAHINLEETRQRKSVQ